MSAPPSGPRAVFRSRRAEERRRRVRLHRIAATAVLVVLAIAAAALVVTRSGCGDGDGGGAANSATGASASWPTASPSPSATAVRTTALADAEVHRGEEARLSYRIDAPAGTTWEVTLEVLDAAGERELAKRVASAAPVGSERELTLALDLPAGTYTYVVHVRGAGGATESGAAELGALPATLRVLPPRPPAFPAAAPVAAALEWAGARDGSVAVAVVDTHGELHGLHAHRTYQAASLAKAILLAAYLRERPKPGAALDATATTMVVASDNASANAIFGVVGVKGMKAVAALAGMEDYEQGTSWLDTRVSAADQARFFYRYLEYVPAARRGFARGLLSGVTRMQRWGIPAAAGPEGWAVYFKGGWLGMDNHLMNQAAWLDKGGRHWALAVLSDENPTRSYGWDTQKGVTGLLLGEEPTAAYLATVLE